MHNRAEESAPESGDDQRDSVLNAEPEAPIATAHHRVVLLPGMEAMLRSVLRDIAAAKQRVMVETYIVRGDALGTLVGDALVAAVARGVPARLLYDPLGSQKTDPAFFDGLRARGVDVRAYRPTDVVLRTASYPPRDHSRIVVIDGGGYTGGAAWGDEWLPRRRGGQGWHDVCLRVAGPSVEDFAAAFEQRWREATGDAEQPRTIATEDRYPDLEFVADTPQDRNVVYERYRAAVRRARARVWLENAYFCPPPEFARDLYDAVARGVDVRVIVPAESDLGLVADAAHAAYGEWIARGVKLYEYTRSMLHSKFALVDDDWSTVGTFNANPPSLGWANEVSVFVYDRAFVARVAQLFEHDLRACRRVTPALIDARPAFDRARALLASGIMTIVDAARPGSK